MPLKLGDYSPAPVFEYEGPVESGFDVENELLIAVPSMAEGVTPTGVLALFYNEAGELLNVVANDENVKIVNGIVGIGKSESNVTEFVEAAYAKVFFWNGLENIVPLAEALYIRK